MKTTNEYRVEHDLLGKRELPVDALYGIQTLRGVENFSISVSDWTSILCSLMVLPIRNGRLLKPTISWVCSPTSSSTP